MDKEYALHYKNLYDKHWWWRAREKFLLDIINELELDSGSNILDVGCGDGLFFEHLMKFGSVSGVETEALLISKDSKHYNKIYNGDIFSAPFSENYFDFILACDVLEHVENEISFLNKLYSLLKPKGVLLLTVPSFNQIWTSHDDKNHHFRRYVKNDFNRLLANSKFKIEINKYFFFSLFFLKFAQRFIEKFLSNSISNPNIIDLKADKIPLRPINKAMIFWYQIENIISRKLDLPFGSSLLVVLRKDS